MSALAIVIHGEERKHRVIFRYYRICLALSDRLAIFGSPPIIELAVFQQFRIISGRFTRTIRHSFPEINFTPGISPATKAFKKHRARQLRIVTPRTVGRIVDCQNSFVTIIVSHRVNVFPLTLEHCWILACLLTLNHSLSCISCLSIILRTLIERIARHSHIHGRECRFHRLLRHIDIRSKHLARFAFVGCRKFETLRFQQVG